MSDRMESPLEEFAEQFAAEGKWPIAVETARMALGVYEAEAAQARNPASYGPLIARARDRIERFLAQAGALGEPTEIEPTADVRAMMAMTKPALGPEDQALIIQARGEVAVDGADDEFEWALGRAATVGGAAVPDRNDPAEAPWMAAELDRFIARLRNARPQGIDATVERMIELASAAPCETALQAARKIARQASLLNRLGQPDRAVTAARKAGQLFADAGPLDGTDEGYFAYSLLPVAHAELADGDLDRAYSAGAYAAKLFTDHKDELIPAALRDLTWAMVVHADIAARQGATDRSRQSLFYAVDTARDYERLPPELVGAPGSMPEAPWGLPVVPTAAEWEDLVAWMWDVAKRLGIA